MKKKTSALLLTFLAVFGFMSGQELRSMYWRYNFGPSLRGGYHVAAEALHSNN